MKDSKITEIYALIVNDKKTGERILLYKDGIGNSKSCIAFTEADALTMRRLIQSKFKFPNPIEIRGFVRSPFDSKLDKLKQS